MVALLIELNEEKEEKGTGVVFWGGVCYSAARGGGNFKTSQPKVPAHAATSKFSVTCALGHIVS